MQNQEEDDGNICETYVENKLHKYEHVLLLLLFFYLCSKSILGESGVSSVQIYALGSSYYTINYVYFKAIKCGFLDK